jgi:hypothetical protein
VLLLAVLMYHRPFPVLPSDGNIPEGDHLSPTDIEANLSTEVALIVLDVLGLFVHHHKVRQQQ